jgi:NTE family protein
VSIAFVLQGGGSLAAGQRGMLRALMKAGITADLVVGVLGRGDQRGDLRPDPTPQGLARLEQRWAGLRRRTVFPLNPWNVVTGLAGRRDGLVSPRRLRVLLASGLAAQRIEDTRITVAVVATDLATGQAVTLTRGHALDALLASSSMPGVFQPVPIGGRLLRRCVRRHTDPASRSPGRDRLLRPAGGRTAHHARHHRVPAAHLNQVFERAAATALDAAQTLVTVLPTPRQHGASPFDFRHTELLIAEGAQPPALRWPIS